MEGLQYAPAHRQETIDLTARLSISPRPIRTNYSFDEIVKEKDASPTIVVPHDRIEWLQNHLADNL